MEISFSEQGLLEEAVLLAFYFYDSALTCATLRTTMPRPRSVLGPYKADLTPDAQKNGVTFTLTEVPAGTYAVLVDAVNSGGTVIGSGCAEGQRVFDRERSEITLTVSRNP